MSLPEVLLWQRLRRRQGGARFRRQHPLGGYILDFYCPDAKLVIEIDGEVHNRGAQPAHDIRRDAALRAHGLQVMRIAASDVLHDPDEIAAAVALAARPLHHPDAPGGPPPHAMHGEDLRGVAS